jgi:hypothetical protein
MIGSTIGAIVNGGLYMSWGWGVIIRWRGSYLDHRSAGPKLGKQGIYRHIEHALRTISEVPNQQRLKLAHLIIG